jgi:RimJ/RimL family protein N-acetyltransferase
MKPHIRHVSEDDQLELTEMLARCSSQSRYRRFHGFVHDFPEPYFTGALKGDPDHFALVAETPTRIVALGSCVLTSEDTCEIGILVEDSCQRQGIGTRLLDMLVDYAGERTVMATVLPDNTWIFPVLRRHEKIKISFS